MFLKTLTVSRPKQHNFQRSNLKCCVDLGESPEVAACNGKYERMLIPQQSDSATFFTEKIYFAFSNCSNMGETVYLSLDFHSYGTTRRAKYSRLVLQQLLTEWWLCGAKISSALLINHLDVTADTNTFVNAIAWRTGCEICFKTA
ncbi:hypothetical protein TSMEX_008737 [Taenia solium]|eukprot:TsM_001061000 transcript=TsM_001061000 gene=TsM_001061000